MVPLDIEQTLMLGQGRCVVNKLVRLVVSQFTLFVTFESFVPLWWFITVTAHHRGTEVTKDSQRRKLRPAVSPSV